MSYPSATFVRRHAGQPPGRDHLGGVGELGRVRAARCHRHRPQRLSSRARSRWLRRSRSDRHETPLLGPSSCSRIVLHRCVDAGQSVGGLWEDGRMSTTAPAPSTLTVLDRARDAMTVRRRAEVEVLEAALAWAHAHAPAGEDDAAGWRSDTIHDATAPPRPSIEVPRSACFRAALLWTIRICRKSARFVTVVLAEAVIAVPRARLCLDPQEQSRPQPLAGRGRSRVANLHPRSTLGGEQRSSPRFGGRRRDSLPAPCVCGRS